MVPLCVSTSLNQGPAPRAAPRARWWWLEGAAGGALLHVKHRSESVLRFLVRTASPKHAFGQSGHSDQPNLVWPRVLARVNFAWQKTGPNPARVVGLATLTNPSLKDLMTEAPSFFLPFWPLTHSHTRPCPRPLPPPPRRGGCPGPAWPLCPFPQALTDTPPTHVSTQSPKPADHPHRFLPSPTHAKTQPK